jgi:FdrA protein
LVSVPGRYAAGVAREALELGRHVFLYSDNVSLEDEI